MWCVQRRACPRPLHLNLFPTSTPPLINYELLLDGQQRVTSLYGLIREGPPQFFDGDNKAFTGLCFNLKNEEFEFISQRRMGNDPLWVSVTDLFAPENSWMSRIFGSPDYTSEDQNNYLQNGLKVGNIRNIDLPVQSLTGSDKTTEVVVDILVID